MNDTPLAVADQLQEHRSSPEDVLSGIFDETVARKNRAYHVRAAVTLPQTGFGRIAEERLRTTVAPSTKGTGCVETLVGLES
jgi:hypothetical protein